MPPSPASRCSPGREHRAGITHKRGCSLESGLPLKAKDDDLALFNDMENRERDNFLLHMADDFDDSISKLRYFSDYKLGINIPSRGESSDLLNVDGEKNDYDWLLTPPDTPLFTSLDDEEHELVSLAPRGRSRTLPILIARSSMTDKTQKSSRSSASPHRLSPSPGSNNSVMQSRRRTSSAPHTSLTPVLRPATPSRRPSTPPNKPSTSAPRSSTPPLRRMSTGSSGQPSSCGRRGVSPVTTSRGNSASPKFRGWQSDVPGFSSEAPPNLRTSLPDRPTSHMRGLSPASRSGRDSPASKNGRDLPGSRNGRDLPASRNGRDSSSYPGRRSMSPVASGSSSSSRSQGRDSFSSNHKRSAASLPDDDVDSLHSAATGTSIGSTARINGVIVNNRAVALSKKLSRTASASSAPKRSFDSALRQMDHRKTPQNMFRPLMSSVPATSFYVGKVNSLHRPMFSRNSSLTTSSNASSEHGVSIAPDMDGSDDDHNDSIGHLEKMQDPDIQDEVFTFDKVDEMDEDTGHEVAELRYEYQTIIEGTQSNTKLEDHENSSVVLGVTASVSATFGSTCAASDHSAVDLYGTLITCSKCGKQFHFMEVDGNAEVCQECAEKEWHYPVGLSGTTLITQYGALQSVLALGTNKSSSEARTGIEVRELPDSSSDQLVFSQHVRIYDQESDCLVDNFLPSIVADKTQHLSDLEPDSQQEAHNALSSSKFQQSGNCAHPGLRADSSNGAGISVLLQKSSSKKWPVVQGRTFYATNVPCSELPYVRDHTSARRHSLDRDNASTSSSADLGSSRLREDHDHQHFSSQKDEMDDSRSDGHAKSQSTLLSFPGVAVNSSEAVVYRKNDAKDDPQNSFRGLEYVLGEKMLATDESEINLENTGLTDEWSSSIKQVVPDGYTSPYIESSMETESSASQLFSHPHSTSLQEAAMTDYPRDDPCIACVNGEDIHQNDGNIPNIEVPVCALDSAFIDDVLTPSDSTCKVDGADASAHDSLGFENNQCSHVDSTAEITTLHITVNMDEGSQTETTDLQNTVNIEASNECSVSTAPEKDVVACASESSTVDSFHDIHEESTVVMVGGPRGHMSRSLTLEEATDTVLFCRSIVHELAYRAAAISMEKEEVVQPEAPRPTITMLETPVPDYRYSQNTVSSKRTPKSQKAKRKRLEADAAPPPPELENNVKIGELAPTKAEIPNKPDSSKPPKLESKCNCTVM